MSQVKIFCVYHKPARLYSSDCIEPIQVGCANAKVDLGILRDDIGDNISSLNGECCELTAHYWVWKNYLPEHPDLEWIGFCHYRRFLDFKSPSLVASGTNSPFRFVSRDEFDSAIFPSYNEKTILEEISSVCDIALPRRFMVEGAHSAIETYIYGLGGLGLREAIDTLKIHYKDYIVDFLSAEQDNHTYAALTFLMKRAIFERYASWMFSFMEKTRSAWRASKNWANNARQEGYVMEHLFNTWLKHEMRSEGSSIAEFDGLLLEDLRVPCGEIPMWNFFERAKSIVAWKLAKLNAAKMLKGVK